MTPPHGSIRVLIVDDEPVFREGLAALLSAVAGMDVAGTAGDGGAAIAAAGRLQPDVVIMDLRMPGIDGVQATRRLTRSGSTPAVLMLAATRDDEAVIEAVTAGARGYLLKGASLGEIVRGIRSVASGGAVFGSAVADTITRLLARSAEPQIEAFDGLTPREIEVLDLVAAGLNNAEIAVRLFLSPKTVRNTVSSIFGKLDVRDRPQAIIRARNAGLGRETRSPGASDRRRLSRSPAH